MRKSLFFILLLSMIGLTNGAQAQIAVMDTSIVQYLERPETGGKVKVIQPAQLAKRVSRAEGVIKYDGNMRMKVWLSLTVTMWFIWRTLISITDSA